LKTKQRIQVKEKRRQQNVLQTIWSFLAFGQKKTSRHPGKRGILLFQKRVASGPNGGAKRPSKTFSKVQKKKTKTKQLGKKKQKTK